MHEGSYFTYVVASRSCTLYIGVTGNLHKRVFQHKWKELDGFTADYNCDRLVGSKVIKRFEGDRARKAVERLAP